MLLLPHIENLKKRRRGPPRKGKRTAPSLPALASGGLPAFRPTPRGDPKKSPRRSSSYACSRGLAPRPTLILCSARDALLAHLIDRAISTGEVQPGIRIADQRGRELEPRSSRGLLLLKTEVGIPEVLMGRSATRVRLASRGPYRISLDA